MMMTTTMMMMMMMVSHKRCVVDFKDAHKKEEEDKAQR